MKNLVVFLLVCLLFSCKKDNDKIKILSAFVDGDSISFVGNAQLYKDVKNELAFGLNYHIFNLDTNNLYIEAYDSTFVKDDFLYPTVTAKYACQDSLGKSYNYHSISGKMHITNESKGVLFGIFYFTLINTRNELDTLEIDKGYFKISMDEYDRVWHD